MINLQSWFVMISNTELCDASADASAANGSGVPMAAAGPIAGVGWGRRRPPFPFPFPSPAGPADAGGFAACAARQAASLSCAHSVSGLL